MEIHEGSRGHPYVANFAKRYSHSSYVAGAELGSIVHGKRCENLERLTFKDQSFDLFITQDVFEHVFDPEAAFREIMRVLRIGGAHVFTVPKHKGLLETRQRAKLSNEGVIEHLLEPNYHGAPEGEGPSLVTWDYGYDFELSVSDWCGGVPVQTFRTRDHFKGIDALFNEVFVVRKPDLSVPPKICVPEVPADFSVDSYLDANPDVKEAGVDAIEHYVRFGWKEGRRVR